MIVAGCAVLFNILIGFILHGAGHGHSHGGSGSKSHRFPKVQDILRKYYGNLIIILKATIIVTKRKGANST